ncbi:MAG: type II toxin-antitoxin system Phd/YefM family antitoxin [Deltaproteobacteria bacterium]|nr:type II toxin-antitoxin system Phd/YefM family antitoxin [Deltaproteobacteria bacterium]
MTRYTVARARQRLATVLDQAEQGETVIIERRGVRFAVRALKPKSRPRRGPPRVEILDPALESGQWSWSWGEDGVRLDDAPKDGAS